jgi:Restriction endonuclease
MERLEPRHIRFIKLGVGNAWADQCLAKGELQADFMMVPHALVLSGDRQAVRAEILASGSYSKGGASRLAGQLLDFYQLGADCLWFTIANGHLWWTFADPEVTWLGGDRTEHGLRRRKAIGGWRNINLRGEPLIAGRLSTALTRVGMTQNAIVNGERYRGLLLALLNGEERPEVRTACEAEGALLTALSVALLLLHQDDFETLVDLIFARGGWHRVSALGGYQADIDLAVEQSLTGERAFVQVKSAASAKVLDATIQAFDRSGVFDRCYFVCHSPHGELLSTRPDVSVWTSAEIADHALRAGLARWVLERV